VHSIFDRLFRTFAAQENPIGFGAADFLELGLAMFLAALALGSRSWIEPRAARFAKRTAWCMLALAALPIGLRLLLLAHHPAPSPDSNEEFANLLIADTLRHGRLHNPPHALPQFFEPAPAYPIGPGALLAIGGISGSPWVAVLFSMGAFSALCYWMLRGWTTPLWALLGGVLAVIEFGPLSAWMITYAGGALAACGGCLVFGALPRILESRRWTNFTLLGLGLVLHASARPHETIWVAIGAALFFLPGVRRLSPKWTAALAAIPLLVLVILPHEEFLRVAYRLRYLRFYLLPPLYLALPFFLLAVREFRFVVALLTLSAILLGASFRPAFEINALAGAVCLLVLLAIAGLRKMPREAAWMILALCGAHFTLWYGVHVFDSSRVSRSLMAFETWDTLNHDNPARRIGVNRQLDAQQGKQLVLVHYAPIHRQDDEWVHNAADMDASRVVWARDLGPDRDQALLRYYPDRTPWLLEPDAQPPRLTPYRRPEPQAPATQPTPPAPKKKSPFEDVPVLPQ